MAESAEMTPESNAAERRARERSEITGPLQVDIELFGYQRSAREYETAPHPTPDRKIHAAGTTVNLSLTGMLARVAEPIVGGTYCLVRFIDAGSTVRPDLRWGLVTRCDEIGSSAYEVAVRFNSPLEHLDVGALNAG